MASRDSWPCDGFEWDAGNSLKSFLKHGVTCLEAEEVFLAGPLVASEDRRHSDSEPRHYCLGRTAAGRFLFVAFTVRGSRIRVISARDMSRRERRTYEQARTQAGNETS